MKKLIAILSIMIVLVGAVFAASGDELKVTTTVAKHIPGFKIFGSEDTAYDTEGTNPITAASTIASTKDISLSAITVNCKINQYSLVAGSYEVAKSKYSGTASLTITATALELKTDSSKKSAAPSGTTPSVTVPAGVTKTASSTNANPVTFTLSYDGRSIQDDAVYATFSFTWAADDTLIPGDYEALITLEYTTP